MKWFFALNESSHSFAAYSVMAKVAVHTALRHTTLSPHCLYDGADNEFTRWLARSGVAIIRCRSSFYPQIEALAQKYNDRSIIGIGAGAFLRVELPRLARVYSWPDETVLYTDCDVMFRTDVAGELQAMRPRYFAVAPELFPDNYLHMNTGVMVMNLASLEKRDTAFHRFIRRHLEIMVRSSWDQEAYRLFYNWPHAFLRTHGLPDRIGYLLYNQVWFSRTQWNRLPPELNWKPYWGHIEKAHILHFHGPKPLQRIELDQGRAPQVLKNMDNEDFRAACRLWDEALDELNRLDAGVASQ